MFELSLLLHSHAAHICHTPEDPKLVSFCGPCDHVVLSLYSQVNPLRQHTGFSSDTSEWFTPLWRRTQFALSNTNRR